MRLRVYIDCLKIYSSSLELPLEHSVHAAAWSILLYSFAQSIMFFIIAPVF